jgi:hypothetical protein
MESELSLSAACSVFRGCDEDEGHEELDDGPIRDRVVFFVPFGSFVV